MENTGSAVNGQSAEQSFPVTENWSVEGLLAMSRQDVLDLWRDAPGASLQDMQGHFMGLIPNAGDSKQQRETGVFMYNEVSPNGGYWLGKAFTKTGENEGEGYNRFRQSDGTIRFTQRFTTEVGPSVVDGRPSLLMYYGAFNSRSGNIVDEIRKLDDWIYLGIGTNLQKDGQRSEPGHFMLVGPTDRWVGGATGEPVPGFVKPSR